MGDLAETLVLDIDFETARAVHRVVRGMHDGECPKCHCLFYSSQMVARNGDTVCPSCLFTITDAEMQEAIRLFASVMERNLAIFETWRGGVRR